MYGLVNNALREFIIAKHDESTWESVVAFLPEPPDVFVSMGSYPDMLTFEIVGHACDGLAISPAEFLEGFGIFWIGYAERHYGEYLRFAGSTFPVFLANLDVMHERIRLSYPELRPPSFRLETFGEGNLRLHYESEREGLEPFVAGLLKGLAQRMGVEAEIYLESERRPGACVFRIHHTGTGSWSSANDFL